MKFFPDISGKNVGKRATVAAETQYENAILPLFFCYQENYFFRFASSSVISGI